MATVKLHRCRANQFQKMEGKMKVFSLAKIIGAMHNRHTMHVCMGHYPS